MRREAREDRQGPDTSEENRDTAVKGRITVTEEKGTEASAGTGRNIMEKGQDTGRTDRSPVAAALITDAADSMVQTSLDSAAMGADPAPAVRKEDSVTGTESLSAKENIPRKTTAASSTAYVRSVMP